MKGTVFTTSSLHLIIKFYFLRGSSLTNQKNREQQIWARRPENNGYYSMNDTTQACLRAQKNVIETSDPVSLKRVLVSSCFAFIVRTYDDCVTLCVVTALVILYGVGYWYWYCTIAPPTTRSEILSLEVLLPVQRPSEGTTSTSLTTTDSHPLFFLQQWQYQMD